MYSRQLATQAFVKVPKQFAVASLVASGAGRTRHNGLAPHAVLRILRIKIKCFDLRFGEAYRIAEVSACEDFRLTVQLSAIKLPQAVSTLDEVLVHFIGVADATCSLHRGRSACGRRWSQVRTCGVSSRARCAEISHGDQCKQTRAK